MIRLLCMALWWPRVAYRALGLKARLAAAPLPEFLAGLLPAPGAPPPRPRLSPAEMGRVIYNVLRWNLGPFRNGCFSRSFLRFHFFRVMGAPVTFHLGVEEGPAGGAPESFAHLRGHAWLTLDGAPCLEWQPERFARYRELYRFPETPAAAPDRAAAGDGGPAAGAPPPPAPPRAADAP